MYGASLFGIYPLDTYRRIELTGGVVYYAEKFNDQSLQDYSDQYQVQVYGRRLLNDGAMVPLGLAFVQETTIFREFGPLSGNTVRLGFEYAPKLGSLVSRRTVDLDARYYKRIAGSSLVALRAHGFKSAGDSPDFLYFGGNHEMRGYDYLEFIGQNAFYVNAEFRFPLIEAMLTPLGVVGGVRGVLFADLGGAWFTGGGYQFASRKKETITPVVGYDLDPATELPYLIYGDPVDVSGFRLRDGRASYGIGLETFALGFPIHFDWSFRTLLNKRWEDVLMGSAGAAQFRKRRFQVWIGFDF